MDGHGYPRGCRLGVPPLCVVLVHTAILARASFINHTYNHAFFSRTRRENESRAEDPPVAPSRKNHGKLDALPAPYADALVPWTHGDSPGLVRVGVRHVTQVGLIKTDDESCPLFCEDEFPADVSDVACLSQQALEGVEVAVEVVARHPVRPRPRVRFHFL